MKTANKYKVKEATVSMGLVINLILFMKDKSLRDEIVTTLELKDRSRVFLKRAGANADDVIAMTFNFMVNRKVIQKGPCRVEEGKLRGATWRVNPKMRNYVYPSIGDGQPWAC